MARLSIGETERLALAALGITETAGGVLRGEDGAEVGPAVAAILLKARHPGTGRFASAAGPAGFARGPLTDGHAAESPGITGPRRDAAVPSPRPAEPGDFTRGPVEDGHESGSPASDPGGNNPHEPGALAAAVLATGAGRLAANVAQDRAGRLTGSAIPQHSPAQSRMVMAPDLRAASVPRPADLTMRAPGERE